MMNVRDLIDSIRVIWWRKFLLKTEFWVKLIAQQIPLGPDIDLLQLGGAWDA